MKINFTWKVVIPFAVDARVLINEEIEIDETEWKEMTEEEKTAMFYNVVYKKLRKIDGEVLEHKPAN